MRYLDQRRFVRDGRRAVALPVIAANMMFADPHAQHARDSITPSRIRSEFDNYELIGVWEASRCQINPEAH